MLATILLIAQLVSTLAFFFYGCICVFTSKLVAEFERYGLSGMRVATGILEILGAVGMLLGFYYPILTQLASAGLSLIMLCAIYVRIRIKDSIFQMSPAIFLFCVNALILYLELP